VIWGHFQHKFSLINDLINYHKFFRRILAEILEKCALQNVFIVELRYIPSLLFDDDRKAVPLEEELGIIEEVVNDVRRKLNLPDGEFHLRLIITGLKILGRAHVQKKILTMVEGRTYSDLISGFDMVNHESVTPPILSFVPDILEGKRQDIDCMPCYLHCGETHDRNNQNIYDAVLLGTRRLGHGFQLFLHPHL
jgi:adenosine deaminase CECR1